VHTSRVTFFLFNVSALFQRVTGLLGEVVRIAHQNWLPGFSKQQCRFHVGFFFNWKLCYINLNSCSNRSHSSCKLWEWWGAGTDWKERLWMPRPWRCSRPGWMEPWAAWAGIKWGGWWPCLWQRGWRFVILEVPSNLGHSVFLWKVSVQVSGVKKVNCSCSLLIKML